MPFNNNDTTTTTLTVIYRQGDCNKANSSNIKIQKHKIIEIEEYYITQSASEAVVANSTYSRETL